MSILTDAELADLWATYEEGLIDTCELRAPVESASASSITGKTWPTVTATAKCAVIDGQGSPRTGEMFDNASLPNTRLIQIPRGTTVAESYHLIPTTGRWAGRTFDVLKVDESGTYGPAVSCQCAEIES